MKFSLIGGTLNRLAVIAVLASGVASLDSAAWARNPFSYGFASMRSHDVTPQGEADLLDATATASSPARQRVAQGTISPTMPDDAPPQGVQPSTEERERMLKRIQDLNVRTGQHYEKYEQRPSPRHRRRAKKRR